MRKILLTAIGAISLSGASAQWSDSAAEQTILDFSDRTVYSQEMATTEDNITYVVYNSPVNDNIATYLQILDKEGKPKFTDGGIPVSAERTRSYNMVNNMLMTDKAGNSLISISDCRNSSDDDTNLSYTIYKVSPEGEKLWGEEGLDLEKGYSNKIEACMNMVQRADGSYVFAWLKDNGNLNSIKVECVSENKEFLWEQTIEIKDNLSTITTPYLVDAGNNQVILVYIKGSNSDIYARKIDFDGESVWQEDTRIYRGGLSSSIPSHTIVRVIPGADGGVFIGWWDDRYATNWEKTHVSYVDAEGKLGFVSGIEGQEVGTSEYIRQFSPAMYYNQADRYLYVLWRETNSGQSYQALRMQKVSLKGELMWDPAGLEIVPIQNECSVGYYSLRGAPDGNVTAFYMSSYSYKEVACTAVTVNGEGESVWDNTNFVFADAKSGKSELKITQLINNSYWIAMWNANIYDDFGESVEKTCIKKINADASLGTSIDVVKNNTDSQSLIYVMDGTTPSFIVNSEKQADSELFVYSISGQKVATVFEGKTNGGRQVIAWQGGASLAKGVYVAIFRNETDVKSIRFVIK